MKSKKGWRKNTMFDSWSSLRDPAVVVALISAIGAYLGVRYRSHGRSLREQMRELREQNDELRKEVDNLKIQLSPNQTPCIWVNNKGEIVSFNGSAILKIFTRLELQSQKAYGTKLSGVIGEDNVSIIKEAVKSSSQTSTAKEFIIGGKLTVKFAVAYVIYDNDTQDAVVEVQLIV